MPIISAVDTDRIDEELFKKIAYRVVGHAIAVHNEFGRLYNEVIYKNELRHRCLADYDRVDIESPIVVSYKSFTKTYYQDLVINGMAPFELKAIETITDAEKAQTLNYLYLTGLQHSKILNFRSDKVDYPFVSTHLNQDLRRNFSFINKSALSSDGKRLTELFHELCVDWGAFLRTSLYTEALTNLMGEEKAIIKKVPVSYQGRQLGYQKMYLINRDEAFKITAFTDDIQSYEYHLQKMITKTPLQNIIWYNMNHHQITIKVIPNIIK